MGGGNWRKPPTFSIIEDSVDYSKHYSMFGVLKFKKCLMYCEKVV